ncbi:hypothetical protein AeRB84_005569 [Aphanomyces euteiches]|nr:hypothetical protein AeRB84_005569 [Aphanomyces euteiches]
MDWTLQSPRMSTLLVCDRTPTHWKDAGSASLKIEVLYEHLDLTEEILDHVSLQGITLAVDAFEAARYNPGSNQWELKTHWKGLEYIESSWEALPKLYGEVQGLVKGFIDELQDEDQRRALLEAVKFLGYPPDVLCPLALGR